MSITSTDPFWSALASYDLGTKPTLGNGATGGAAYTPQPAAQANTGAGSVSSAAATQTLAEVLGGAGAPASPSSTGNLMSQVLSGQSSGASVAVASAVNESLLDTLL